MKTSIPLPFVALLLFAVPSLAGSELHVDALLGDNTSGDGSATAPFRTITHALAQVGGTGPKSVHVAPGLYNQALGESFPLVLGAEVSLVGHGAYACVISGGGSETLVRLGRASTVADVTLRRGGVAVLSQGAAFSAPELRVLRNVVVQDSTVGLRAVDALHSDHGVVLLNSLLTRNSTAVELKTTGFDFQSVTLAVHGSTITDNLQWLEASGIGELYLALVGSIVYGNGADTIPSFPWVYPAIQGNLLGDATFDGTDGNLFADPLFAQPTAADVHLTAQSPAVDWAGGGLAWPPAGKWVPPEAWVHEANYADTLDLGGAARLVGAAIDAGAYERAVPTLYSAGSFQLGNTLVLKAQGDPSDSLFVGVSLGLLPAPVLGSLWLADPVFLAGVLPVGGSGIGSKALAIPAIPSAAGLYV